jgi:membrane associated rhomboid family serine protease
MSIFRGASAFDSLTPVTKKLLIANVGMFFAQMVFPELIGYLGLVPNDVMHRGRVWEVVTYAFLHGSGWHLFFNMFALWMFGPHIEGAWGSRRFLTYYFICLLGAAGAQFLLAPDVLVVGASGAIYGILLAFGLMVPDAVIYLFFFFPVRAIQAVMFIALLTLVSAMSAGGSRVAHFAHLGGMLTGFLYFKFPVWRDQFRLYRAARLFKNPRGRRAPAPRRTESDELKNEVDRILEKISAQGVDSLTSDERATMDRYAKRQG